MSTANLVTPDQDIERDRYGRPLVMPENGTKKVPYTRATTFIDCLEDKFNLQKWFQRQVAVGLSLRPDLRIAVTAHKDDKKRLDEICEQAREAAASSAAATTGTALHALTELVDRGRDLPSLEPAAQASLDAYVEATKDLKPLFIEQFCVQDWLQVGGTPDRVVKVNGETVIADIKTGSIEYGIHKIAMQLAIYARSHTYDVRTGKRGIHGADVRRGLVIHLPSVEDPKDATCELVWVDLLAGWEGVKLAKSVREVRKLKFRDLATPFGADPNPGVIPGTAPETPTPTVVDIPGLISMAADADALRALWAAHESSWTDDYTRLASARIAEINRGSDSPAA